VAFSPEAVQLCYQLAIVGRRDLELAPEPRGGLEMVLLRMLAFRQLDAGVTAPVGVATPVAATRLAVAVTAPGSSTAPRAAIAAASNDWLGMVRQLDVSGPTAQLAAHCSLQARLPGKLQLVLDASGEHLRRPAVEEKLRLALCAALAEELKLEFVSPAGSAPPDTPARRQEAAVADRMQTAVQAIHADPNIKQMVDLFGAVVQPESIRPIDN
jgi:DNA polymerase-3 subunit gamma/tau